MQNTAPFLARQAPTHRNVRRETNGRPAALCLWIAAGMAATIAGTVLASKWVAFVSIGCFVIAILRSALRDTVSAVGIYLGYSAMEGMYKYLSGFWQGIYVIAPFLQIAIIYFWMLTWAVRGKRIARPPLMGLLGLFTGWGVVQIFNPNCVGVLQGLAALLLWYVGPLAIYLVAFNLVRSIRQVFQLCYVLIAVCTVVSGFAIIQFTQGHAWTESHLPGYELMTQTDWFVQDSKGKVTSASFRPASTTSMGGGCAGWSHVGIVLAAGLLFLPGLSLRARTILATCLLINIVGILVSGVRLWVFVAAFDVFILILLTARSLREMLSTLLRLSVVGGLVMLAIAGAQTISGGIIVNRYIDTAANPFAKFQQDRGYNIDALFRFVEKYPLGIGYQQGLGKGGASGNTREQVENEGFRMSNGETQFGKTAADMGLPGLILLLLLMFGVVFNGWRTVQATRDAPQIRLLSSTLFASLLGYVLACFGGPAMNNAMYFWLAAGILPVLPLIDNHGRTLTLATRDANNVTGAP